MTRIHLPKSPFGRERVYMTSKRCASLLPFALQREDATAEAAQIRFSEFEKPDGWQFIPLRPMDSEEDKEGHVFSS